MRTIPGIIRIHRSLKHVRLLSFILIAVTLMAPLRSQLAAPVTTESTIVLDAASAPLLQSTAEIVSNELGNQTNPHLQCNLVSYTFDDFQGISTIHYKDMATGADNVIPGNQWTCFQTFPALASLTPKLLLRATASGSSIRLRRRKPSFPASS